MTNLEPRRVRLLPYLVVLAMFCAFACGDSGANECASCPNVELVPACEEAAAQCDQFGGDARQTCLAEALGLCE
ncbi:MAG: hypothetical protein WBM46_08950 [Polyangiales bacterium]